MNEKGLVANMLWLVSSQYPKFSKEGGTKKGLAVSLWAQYALDNFETVAEEVEHFRKEEFVLVTDFIPGKDKSIPFFWLSFMPKDIQVFFDLLIENLSINNDLLFTV